MLKRNEKRILYKIIDSLLRKHIEAKYGKLPEMFLNNGNEFVIIRL